MFTASESLIDHAITAPPGQSGARILEEMDIAYSDGLARDMAPLYERVKSVIPSVEWPFDRRNDAFDTFIKRRHIARQTVGIGNIHFFQNARTALSRRCGYGVVNQTFTGSKHSRPLFILTLSIIVIL